MHRIFIALAATIALAGCQQAELSADEAVVRLPAVPGRPGAAYFTIRGGAEDATLLKISTPGVIRTEMHEMKQQGDMMAMAPVRDVSVPAGQSVKFQPGGKHVMLYDISPSVRAGGTLPLKLTFADGRSLEVNAHVKAANTD